MTAKTLNERAAAENATNGGGELDESRAVFFANGFHTGDEFTIPYFTEGDNGTLCTHYFPGRGKSLSTLSAEEKEKSPKTSFVIVNVENKIEGITGEKVNDNAKRVYPTLFHRSREKWTRDEFGIKQTGESVAPSGEPARDFITVGGSLEALGFRGMRGYRVRIKNLEVIDGANFDRDRLQKQRVAHLEYVSFTDNDGHVHEYGTDGWMSPVQRAAKYPKILTKVVKGGWDDVFKATEAASPVNTGTGAGSILD